MSDTIPLGVVLGALLYVERAARGLSQRQVADAAGLHVMSVSKIERGVQHDLGVETLRRLVAALSTTPPEISVGAFVGRAERWQARLAASGAPGDLAGQALAATMAIAQE